MPRVLVCLPGLIGATALLAALAHFASHKSGHGPKRTVAVHVAHASVAWPGAGPGATSAAFALLVWGGATGSEAALGWFPALRGGASEGACLAGLSFGLWLGSFGAVRRSFLCPFRGCGVFCRTLLRGAGAAVVSVVGLWTRLAVAGAPTSPWLPNLAGALVGAPLVPALVTPLVPGPLAPPPLRGWCGVWALQPAPQRRVGSHRESSATMQSAWLRRAAMVPWLKPSSLYTVQRAQLA